MTERWRPVVGYEGLYEVSDRGQVRSLERVVTMKDGRRRPVTARILKLSVGGGWPGSVVAYLWKDGKRKEHSVQRLVFAEFVGDPPSRMPRLRVRQREEGGRVFDLDKVRRLYGQKAPLVLKDSPTV
jgi:hypothetical protein